MIFMTSDEIAKNLSERLRKIRKVRKISQEFLASMSNVSYGTIKRFERSGEISLQSLIKICLALDVAAEINNLFKEIPFRDISEVIKYGK